MLASRPLLAVPVALFTVALSSAASAGATAPLSSLAALPGPVAPKVPSAVTIVPGLGLKSKEGYRGAQWHELTAATGRGYCINQNQFGYRWASTYGTTSTAAEEDLDLDRLVEKDGVATLERTTVRFDPGRGTIEAKGRSQVILKEVARTAAGVVVWAFRQERAIVILARGVGGGVEGRQMAREEGMSPFVSADGCPFAGARIDARRPESGALAQLTGTLPAQGTGKERVVPKFIIDASVSRVARDPEPLLAVRVRMQE
ncbi:hypothetical protein BH11MYX4_BH11MYX4_37960 [soil metagenome]